MKRSGLLLLSVYFLVAVADLVLIYLELPAYRWFSKPLLMPLLLMAFLNELPRPLPQAIYYVVFALFFSWCGDVFLQADGFFIPGLVSFLLAHIFYIIYFKKQVSVRWKWMVILPVIIYLSAFTVYLFPYLGEMKMPVVFYSLTIGTMLVMAFHVSDKQGKRFTSWFRYGALFFVLSDSVLAINLFVEKMDILALVVMITYVLAQAMIVRGAMIQLSK